jgi:hypothetical protein
MSIIAKIDSMPLFTSKMEALKFARLNGLIGFHKHTHFGKVGYMAGRNHSEVKRANSFVNKTTADVSIVKLQQGLYKTKPVELTEPVRPVEPITPIVQAPVAPRVTQTTSPTSGGRY